ncbi:hypothetical protein LPTSP4_35980 [Leptospira ryugenii]|uniref:Uncharacterized protein n=1 Tax=Leptospira ryugenii TaxID=1917863 RepID=A0A2P2E5A9_9LEPT|nr:hypothetical protein [Leptospira ryugenii]GBF52060.1 hypothetical protein LPTSP4_35980 [Leptospira ryugenii]
MENYILLDNTFSSEANHASSINTKAIAKSENGNLGKQFSLIFSDRLKKGLLVETEIEDGYYLVLNKELDITEQGITYQEAVENFLAFLYEDFDNINKLESSKLDAKLKTILQKYKELLI